jgi:hypothetical protein
MGGAQRPPGPAAPREYPVLLTCRQTLGVRICEKKKFTTFAFSKAVSLKN